MSTPPSITSTPPLKVAVIEGTTREGRQSIHAARYIHDRIASNDNPNLEAIWVDPLDYEMPKDGNGEDVKDPKYTKITQEADAFFIIVPEYNHAFPGSLKRLLDSELKNYIHKPVAFAGVSAGPWGGVRAIEALVNVVRELGLVATFTDVQFPQIQNVFDDNGMLQDQDYEKRVQRALDELEWMATTLRYGRENVEKRIAK